MQVAAAALLVCLVLSDPIDSTLAPPAGRERASPAMPRLAAQPPPVAAQPAAKAPPIAPPQLVVAGAAAAPEERPAAVQLGWCEAAGCVLTFTFGAPAPEAKVVFDPPQAGTQAWRSPTELVFTPAAGAMLAGHELAVSIPEIGWTQTLTVPFFEQAGKVARWPVTPGKPRFVAFLNGHVLQLGRGPLFALYDQPVDPDAIARRASAKVNGKAVALRVRRPTTTTQIYDAPISLEHLVTVELAQLPPDGETVALELPSIGDDGAATPHGAQLLVNTTLTASGFTEDTDGDIAQKGRRTPLSAEWTVGFSNQITARAFEHHLAIVPRPKAMSTHVWGQRGVVRAQLEPGVLYRLTVDDELHDVLGNPLRAAVVASFRSQDRPPALALPDDRLVLEAGHARLPVRVTNVGDATLTTHRFATVADWLSAQATHPATCDGTPQDLALAAPVNTQATREIALPPGLHCVAVTAKGRGSEGIGATVSAAALVQVSGLAATLKVSNARLFAWVTRLADGRPVDGAKLEVLDEHGASLATATTAGDGTALIDQLAIAGPAGLASPAFLVVNGGELVAPLVDDQLSHARQFGLDGKIPDAEPLSAAMFTERGVYRPGETVHVKAWVRDPDSGRPATGELAMVIDDPRAEQVAQRPVKLDDFGGAVLELALKDDAKVGEYTIRASQGGRQAVRTFRVEEYRVPTFAVTVATDEPWQTGVAAHAAITASYLHGGSLAGRDVTWEVSRAPEPFAPPGLAGFVFDAAEPGARVAESLTHGTGRLDGTGRLVVQLTPSDGAKAGPMRYVVSAAVTDVDRQVYAGKLARVVHPADLYVGIAAPQRRVFAAGDTLSVPIVAVTPDGAARAGVEVTATLERVEYHGVTRLDGEGTQRLNRPVASAVARCAVTTRAAPATCTLPIAAAGEYTVRATAQDRRHRPIEAAFRVSASGGNPVAWPRFDHERIRIIADKPSYRPGDVARLVVQSPFPQARGLLTIERNGVLEHRLFTIDGDTPELAVPITEQAVPNVYASVVLVRGRIHDAKDATGFETGAPAFRIGYAELRVEPRAHRLEVEVKPASARAYPGTQVAVDVTLRDAAGKPRAGQAIVMVVDEAVLGMTGFRTPDPIAELFAARPLAVRTGETRLELLTSRRSRREQVFPAGDGGDGGGAQGEPRAGDELPADLRRLFKSTAYYDPDVRVGADGRARVVVALPDNVTTYRIMAIAVDGETRAGAGEARLVASKPLIVAPVLPRFVHPGDHLRIEARVFNGTDGKGRVAVASALAGLVLDGGAASAAVDVTPGGEARLGFPVAVPDDARGEATVRFSATLGAFHDAVEVRLPILDPGSSRKLVVSKLVTGSERLRLALPADLRPGTLKVEIVASTTPLSELKDAVSYLMTYPNGCIEQTTSTAYPLVMLHDLLPEMGVTVDEAELRKMSEAGVKRILSFQTSSGGLSYWPGSDAPHAFATAFGLTALIEAKHKGYDVPDAALARMADFLEAALRQGKITGEMPHMAMADADTRAFFVLTLGRLGRPQPGYVSTLWSSRDQLTPFGLAFLGVAVTEGAGDRALLAPILAAVRAAAKEQPREAWFDTSPKGGYSFDSPLRTHAGALLAFADAGTDGAMTGKLLTGLLARRVAGMWGNTQENVFGIMAVARLAGASTEKPALAVRVNGKPIDPAQLHPVSDRVRRLALAGADLERGDLDVEISNGGKPVFATVRMEYIARLDDKNRAPRAAGLAIARRYETIDGASLEGKRVKLGSLVRVRLRVNAAAAQHYVAIDDKLPAGLEPLNAALATTEIVAAGKLGADGKRALDRLSYSELRDARVAFYLDDMPAGSYELVYVARATTPGKFIRPAAVAEAMYQPDVSGASSIDDVVVE